MRKGYDAAKGSGCIRMNSVGAALGHRVVAIVVDGSNVSFIISRVSWGPVTVGEGLFRERETGEGAE